MPVSGLELVQFVLGKMVLNLQAALDLLSQYVLLVEQEDEVRVQQEASGPNFVEQVDGLLEFVASVLLVDGVKRGAIDEEHDCRHSIEHLDPLATLPALAADVEHAEGLVDGGARFDWQLHLELQLLDVARSPAALQNIVIVWQVIDISDFVNAIQQTVD